jgi:hypothetical protein
MQNQQNQNDATPAQRPYSRPVLVKGPVLSAVTAAKTVSASKTQ